MLTRRTMIGTALAGLLATPLQAAISFDAKGEGFDIASGDGTATPLFVDARDFAGVRRAAKDLAADVGRVTGTDAPLLGAQEPLPKRLVIAGSLGRNKLIDSLAASGKLKVDDIRGKWEAYSIQTIKDPFPGVREALVITGSDKRGAIYGIYDLSQAIGVSPWYWWADVPVVRRKQVRVSYGRHVQGSPAVKYRGIFLNDEAPCLTGWAAEKFGGLNSKFYARLFELLLRLRANYIWPAMWDNSFAVDDPDNARLADDYGIVMGTSHHEPMTRAHKEWTSAKQSYGNGEWNYLTNRPAIQRFFREGIARNRDHEVLVTMGMRGDGDVALAGTGGIEGDVKLLETVIADQRRIIAEEKKVPVEQVPQVWVLFTEVQKYYDAGLKLPSDVTLMFADDNVGNLRRLPTAEERASRSGGFGIYMHMDMHGGPFSYKWLNTTPFPKLWEQMNLALEYGADRIWIANVGDMKPLELPIEFFLAMAWDPSKVSKEKIAGWTRDWAEREFGPLNAAEIAYLTSRYAKYNGWRKPELLEPDTYSLDHYREAERIWELWNNLEKRAEALNEKLPPEQRDAYYQLVLHPIRACANLNHMLIAAARNRRFAQQGRTSANLEAAEVRRLFQRDREITAYYNKVLAGGKWNHLMDQTHIGYFDWYSPEYEIMPEVTEIKVDDEAGFAISVEGASQAWPGYYLPPSLPVLDSISGNSTYIDVFPQGTRPVTATVTAELPWVRIREAKAFGLGPDDRRYWIDVDWARAPVGRTETRLTVKDASDSVQVKLVLLRASARQAAAARGAFGGMAGAFGIPADGFRRNVPARGVRWEPIPDYGRVAVAMSPFPVTAASFVDPAGAPYLEYPLYLAEAGTWQIDLVTGPTLKVDPGHMLSVAVALDEGPAQISSVFTPERRADEEFLGNAHAQNVRNTSRSMSFRFQVDAPGRHMLKVSMVDATLVLQNIIVSKGQVPASFFGPPLRKANA